MLKKEKWNRSVRLIKAIRMNNVETLFLHSCVKRLDVCVCVCCEISETSPRVSQAYNLEASTTRIVSNTHQFWNPPQGACAEQALWLKPNKVIGILTHCDIPLWETPSVNETLGRSKKDDWLSVDNGHVLTESVLYMGSDGPFQLRTQGWHTHMHTVARTRTHTVYTQAHAHTHTYSIRMHTHMLTHTV